MAKDLVHLKLGKIDMICKGVVKPFLKHNRGFRKFRRGKKPVGLKIKGAVLFLTPRYAGYGLIPEIFSVILLNQVRKVAFYGILHMLLAFHSSVAVSENKL
ncbi:MAG: hypothetical protein HFI33_14650 [Lachnospiraceae bacterium]|nr:hypothetical protein [Lachnospiraceae bacterium]